MGFRYFRRLKVCGTAPFLQTNKMKYNESFS